MTLTVLVLGVGPLQLRAQEAESESETWARRGMFIGAATGGVLSGVGLGLLSSGLCESGQGCDNAFREGFVLGFVAGGVVGGIAGLVIGAGIPRGDAPGEAGSVRTPPGPWQLRLSAGPRWAGAGPVGRSGPWVGLSLMRPTSSSIRWGLETAYLAGRNRTGFFTLRDRDGSDILVRSQEDRRLWNVSLVAARSFGSGDGTGPYLVANAGVHPLREDLSLGPVNPGTAVLSTSESGLEAYPGIGVGAGGAWRIGDRFSFGVEGRLHLIVALGDGLGLPLGTLGGSLGLSF